MRSLRLIPTQQSTKRLKPQMFWKLGGVFLLAFMLSIPLHGSFITDVMLCSATTPAPLEGGSIKITLGNMLYKQEREPKSIAPETGLPSPLMPNEMPDASLRKSGGWTASLKQIQSIVAIGILLTLGLIFLSSFVPALSGTHARTRSSHKKREAANFHKRRLKRTPECVTADMPLSTLGASKDTATQAQVLTAPRSKKHERSFQQLEDLEDVLNLQDLTAPHDDEYPMMETVEVSSASSAQVIWPAPSLQAKKAVKTFFAQGQFQLVEVTPTLAVIRSTTAEYEQYGDIPVAIVTKTTLNEAAVQAVFQAMTTQGRVADPKLALAVVDELPHYSAYQRICQLAAERQTAFLPVSLRLMEKALRNGNCPQTLEKIIASAFSSRNLYETAGSVENPLEFFGREKMMATLLDSMSHLQHIGLFGPRKIGKTSLVWQLREQMAQHIVAYIDLQHVPRDCSYLYQIILDECVRDASFKYPEIKLPAFERTKGAILPNYSTQFIQHLVRVWETLKAHRHDIKIVLLLDEAEHFVPNLTEDEEGFSGFHEFMGVIRGVSQQYGFLVSIIVSSRPEISRIDTYRGQSNPGFHYYKEVFLSSLAETGCNQMIQNLGAQMGMSYNEEALSRIYYETGGHPYVTRQFCSLLAQQDNNDIEECCVPNRAKTVEVQDIEQAISDYLEQKSDYLESIWQRLSYIEQEILLILTTHHNSCALEDIIASDLSYDAKRQRRKAVSNLIEHEIIEKCENKYSIRMGLFERFLQASN